MSIPILITMQGQLPTPPYQAVVWTVYNAPDNTGAQSGYGAGVLQNIQATAVSAGSVPLNPLALGVGGDLSGQLPNPSVSGFQGKPVSATAPIAGQVLVWSGAAWVPATQPILRYVAFSIDTGTITIVRYNWTSVPVLTYNGIGLYTVMPAGAGIALGSAWCNYNNVTAGPNVGWFASASVVTGAQVNVSTWSSLAAAPTDPNDPDDTVTLFWFE